MQLHSVGFGIIFRILLVDTFVPERCAIFCWQVIYEDVPSFLNQWKLKRSLILFFEDIFYKAGGALNK